MKPRTLVGSTQRTMHDGDGFWRWRERRRSRAGAQTFFQALVLHHRVRTVAYVKLQRWQQTTYLGTSNWQTLTA